MIYHEEPIYRDGKIVGSTTSGAWGHRVGRSLGLGYVHCQDGVTADWIAGGRWELELAWKRLCGEGAAVAVLRSQRRAHQGVRAKEDPPFLPCEGSRKETGE